MKAADPNKPKRSRKKAASTAVLFTNARVGYIPQADMTVMRVDVTSTIQAKAARLLQLFLVDKSGSMRGDDKIELLKKKLIQLVVASGADDEVAIITFDGHNHSDVLVEPTRCTEKNKNEIVKSIKGIYASGGTVPSEAVDRAASIVSEIKKNQRVSLVMFTDGLCEPSRWRAEEEERRTTQGLQRISSTGHIVSTVGFGGSYDEGFLRRIADATENKGITVHASKLGIIDKTFEQIKHIVSNTNMLNLSVNLITNDGLTNGVYRMLPEVSFHPLRDANEGINLRGIYGDSETVYFKIGPGKINVHYAMFSHKTESGDWDGKSANLDALTADDAREFLTLLGGLEMNRGDDAKGRGFLADAGIAMPQAMNALEAREQRDHTRRFFANRKFIGEELKTTRANLCTLNILRVLLEGENKVYINFVGDDSYQRGVAKAVEDEKVRVSPHSANVEINNYASHESRLNFSLAGHQNIEVLDDESGKYVPMQRERTYNVVRDGELVMRAIDAHLDAESYQKLVEFGVLKGEPYKANKTYKIPLGEDINGESFPVVNKHWARPMSVGGFGLINLMVEEADLEAEQKYLNARLKELPKPRGEGGLPFYRPKSAGREEGNRRLNVKHVEYKLLKYKSTFIGGFPYEEGLIVKYKQLHPAVDAKDGYLQALALGWRLRQVKDRLRNVRFISRCIVAACETVGSSDIPWGASEVNRHNKTEQAADYEGKTLKRVAWREEILV